MSLNSEIQPTRPTITELVENIKNENYFVDDSFQRRLVWTEKQKIRLIQTVLMGYPMPEIYLWQQPADPETGKQLHSIVDGQQRLTTLAQFVANEWALSESALDDVEGVDLYKSKFWRDLDPTSKQNFWQYVINVRTIPTKIANEQIIDVFRRLNETDKSLNPQELRNAEFNGEFIRAAERVTELDVFKRLKPFQEANIRRMADIDFASRLLIFLRRGLIEENIKTINETYDLYNDEYAEAGRDVEEINLFLGRCETSYFLSKTTRAMFIKPVNLYTLFCAEKMLLTRGEMPENFSEKLDTFVTRYQTQEDTDPELERYRFGANSGTSGKAKRSARINALISFLTN